MGIPPFATTVAMSAIQFGVVLTPMMAYGLIRPSKDICAAAFQSFLLGCVQTCLIVTPSIGWFASLQFNWLQKTLAFLGTFLWAKVAGYNSTECGFVLPKRKSMFLLGLFLGLVLGLFDLFSAAGHWSKPKFEMVLFELLMPGLHEETIYRGLMLQILDKPLGTLCKVFGVEMGWGSVITSILFALAHLVAFDKKWQIGCETDFLAWLDMLVFGLAMCWLRYKSGSIWPCVLAHNAGNSLTTIASYVLG